MASPYANYGTDFFKVEYRVNGLWNHILAQVYIPGVANNDFIISPEAYPKPEDTKGLKADLLVSSLRAEQAGFSISTPKLVYEGKGADGDGFPKIMDQLEKWLMKAALISQFDCWAIGTSGSQVAFMKWEKDSIVWLKWENGSPVPVASHKAYDITQNADWGNIVAMLDYLRNHVPSDLNV